MMLVVTTKKIAGRRTQRMLGQVFGLAVRTRGLEGNIMAGLASLEALDGQAMTEFAAGLVAARDEAIARMVEQAAALGADAVVQLRFDSASVGHDMSEIVAYGTAVVTEPRATARDLPEERKIT
jgi:uncharacterized protein YbjQ (UPF0145 family)